MDKDKVEKLVSDLAKPTFLLRMARNNPRKGSEERTEKALAEIDRIVTEYNQT
jgi:hypothetical protein